MKKALTPQPDPVSERVPIPEEHLPILFRVIALCLQRAAAEQAARQSQEEAA